MEHALFFNTIGGGNTACGFEALLKSTRFDNTALGALAGQNLTAGNLNIDIGNQGVPGEANPIRIGAQPTLELAGHSATFIAGIRGATTGKDDVVRSD